MASKNIESAIHTRLIGYVALTTLCAADHIYATKLKQGVAPPGVVHNVIYGDPTMASAMGSDADIVVKRIQIDSYAATKHAAQDIAYQVKKCLTRYRGTSDSIVILDIFCTNDGTDNYEPDTQLFRVTQEFRVWCRIS